MLCSKCGKEIQGMPVLDMGRYLDQRCYVLGERHEREPLQARILDFDALDHLRVRVQVKKRGRDG